MRPTYVDLLQLLPLGGQVEVEAVHVAGEGGRPHQQDDQDHVGKEGREVHQLKQAEGEIELIECEKRLHQDGCAINFTGVRTVP